MERCQEIRERWRGPLCQGRFASFVMAEPYLLAAARYMVLRRHERPGRPLGTDTFLRHVEGLVGHALHRLKPGPKRKKSAN